MKIRSVLLMIVSLFLCVCLLCGCADGLLQTITGKTKQAVFNTYYDYGFHKPDKAVLLMDGSTVFVDAKLIAGDVVYVDYSGEMYIQETYPGTVVFQNGRVERVEVQQAKVCILSVVQNAQTGEKQLVNQLDQAIESAPDFVLTDWDGSYMEWRDLEVGTTLYGSFDGETDGLPTEIAGLYTYLPRV